MPKLIIMDCGDGLGPMKEVKTIDMTEDGKMKPIDKIMGEWKKCFEESFNKKDDPYECYCPECGECLKKPDEEMCDDDFEEWFIDADINECLEQCQNCDNSSSEEEPE